LERLKRRLAPHSFLALDTSVFIYHFESHPTYLPLTRYLLGLVASGSCEAVISELALLELLVKPLSLEQVGLADRYEILLEHFPHLSIRPIDRAVIRRAAQLRGRNRLRTPDAIHLATALESGATLFLCNDKGLRPVKGIEFVVLDDFV
jgi:predicted nucleic acid-binding protein